MVFLVFLNHYDQKMHVLGKSLPEYLKGSYVKVYTRYESKEYEYCEAKDTFAKIREYAQVFDQVIVSFGIRLFPPSAYHDLLKKYKNSVKNLVFLKKLKGSKTWTVSEDGLTFDNYRIADSGLFVLQAKDILASKTDNFNTHIKDLVARQEMDYRFISYWISTNKPYSKEERKKK